MKFSLILFLSAHWVGCLFFWLARLNHLNEETWVAQFESLMPYFSRSRPLPHNPCAALVCRCGYSPRSVPQQGGKGDGAPWGCRFDASIAKLYLVCLYRGFNALANIGYPLPDIRLSRPHVPQRHPNPLSDSLRVQMGLDRALSAWGVTRSCGGGRYDQEMPSTASELIFSIIVMAFQVRPEAAFPDPRRTLSPDLHRTLFPDMHRRVCVF